VPGVPKVEGGEVNEALTEAMIRKAIARIKQCPATPPETLFTQGFMVVRNTETGEVTITDMWTGHPATDDEIDWLVSVWGAA
jgi:hypothetical protein